MIALTDSGWVIVGAKGSKLGPYRSQEEAIDAMFSGATESCSDGGCGNGQLRWKEAELEKYNSNKVAEKNVIV